MTVTKFPETRKARRGHNFYAPKAVMSKIPKLYATDKVDAADKIVWLHYFTGGSDWWVTEYDPETGVAFGYACLNGDTQNAEWGYMSLPEMEEVYIAPFTIIERDCYWTPEVFSEMRR